MFRLYCYILENHDASRVDIEDDCDVNDLKEAILNKNPNILRGMDAAQLKLWKVYVLFSEVLTAYQFYAKSKAELTCPMNIRYKPPNRYQAFFPMPFQDIFTLSWRHPLFVST